MKNFLLFSAALLLSIFTMGQSTANYAFTYSFTGSLVDISSGATSLMTGNNDDAASSVNNIGFAFFFMGVPYTQFSANSNGQIRLGSTVTSTTYFTLTASTTVLAPMSGDNEVNNGMSFKVIGTAPNRILVIEWNQFYVYYTNITGAGNMQALLYESSGVIDYIYGDIYNSQSAVTSRSTFISSSNTATTAGTVTVAAVPLYAATSTLVVNNFAASVLIANLGSTAQGSRTVYTFAPPTAPPQPGGGAISFTSVSYTTMSLNWTDITGEYGYAIYRSDDGGITYNYIATTAANAVTYPATGLMLGKTYYWKVYAVNEGRYSTSLDGNQATLPAGDKVSAATGNWNDAATWSPSGVPTVNDNVTILNDHTVTINAAATCNNLTVGGGTTGILQYEATTARALVVGGNVTVAAGGTFQTAISGSVVTHSMSIAGSLAVEGTFDMNMGTAGTAVTFTGVADASVSGAGATCDFFSIIVNKGTNKTPVLDVTRVITMSSPAASGTRLTLTNGTLKLSSASTIIPYFGSQTICTANGKLWLNNASASVSCVGTGTATGAGSPTITGELRIDNGTFGYGSGNNTATFSSTTGVLRMSGGTFNMYGAIAFNSSTGTQFIMSGGAINVDPQAGNNLASTTIFSIGASTTVNWSGGTVTIVDPHNATAGVAWSATTGGTKSVTGGTLRLGDGTSTSTGGATAATNGFGFFSSMPVWNLEITTMNSEPSRQVRLSSSATFSYATTLTVNSGGYLFLGSGTSSSSLVVYGNTLNNGTIAGCEPLGSQSIGTFYLLGQSGAQTITGTGSFTNLASLTIDNYGTGVSSSIAFRVRRVNLMAGSLDPTNITIGNPSTLTQENPIVQIGRGTATVAAGTFTMAPSFDETEGQRSLIYSVMLGAPTMGSYNEIGTGASILTALTLSDGDGLTIPADRTISIGGDLAGTLTMTLGNINLSGGTLTLGNAAATPGTLTYTAGYITNGTFKRWYPTTGLPTAVGTGIGYYPLSNGTDVRQVQLFFSSATALSAGGTISVAANNVAGLTSITGFPDGDITVDKRSNSNWVIGTDATIALTSGATMSAAIRCDNIAVITTVADLRMIRATDAVATYLAGSGTVTNPVMNRTAMTLTDLANTFYMGGASSNIALSIQSIASGAWEDPATWNSNTVPTLSDNVTIMSTHIVTVNAAAGVANKVTINAGGTLNISGSSLTIGPAGGGNKIFTNNGSLTVSAGTLNINGNFVNASSAGNVFTQSGGNINVDGNAGGVAANSVASGTALAAFTLGTPTTVIFSGGTFTIVDPHAVSATSYALSGGMSTSTNCGLGHTFQFGDGVSTDKAPGGFYVYLFPGSSYLQLGNVVVNGTASMPRYVNMNSTYGILGDLTINSYGEFRLSFSSNYFGGNITVNANGTLTNSQLVTQYLASYANSTYGPATTAQTISGTGYFRNSLPTASVSAGGTGYVVGDILTVIGGTFTNQARFVVAAVTTGAVTSVTAVDYAYYSVTPTTPAATTGGTGSGCTLTSFGNMTPAANLYSLTVNNNHASGVTIARPLNISSTLTLTLGVVNTTAANLFQIGTASAAGFVSVGSATAYINGPLARTYPLNRTAIATQTTATLFPVGKSGTYMPIWIDPNTGAASGDVGVVFTGEAFLTRGAGSSAGPGVTTLSDHNWQALCPGSTGGKSLLSSYIQVSDAGITSTNQILQAPDAAGAYIGIPVASNYTATTLTTGSAISKDSYYGYFAYGELLACDAPTEQPTLLGATYKTSTGFVGTFTAAGGTPPPSNYLVVRYLATETPTTPFNYVLYVVGGTALGGTIVSTSSATTFTETTLTAGTTYRYLVYSYNNSACYGPVYYLTSPLDWSVTTCAGAITAPGTPVSSAISTTGFTATWAPASPTPVNYLLDVSTSPTFATFVAGYNGLDVGTDVLTKDITPLDPATTYYVRVRAVDAASCYSSYSGTLSQATACNPNSTFPWSEGFEGMATVGAKVLPVCWSYENVAGTNGPVSSATTGTYYGPNTGSKFIYTYYGTTTWVFPPQMHLTSGVSYDFSFYMMNKVVTTPVDFLMDVAYGTTNTSAGMTNVLATGVVCNNSSYVKFTYTVIPATTGDYYFGIKTTSASSTPWYISFDDFAVGVTPVPTVTTTAATLITGNTAQSGGTVSGGGVTARGVCWSELANPTTSDPHTTDGTGTGAFTSNMSGLSTITTYHYRAYATNITGTNYGDDLTFTTINAFAPTVTMGSITTVKDITATAGGTVVNDGGSGPITDNGFVYSSTNTNPTVGGLGVTKVSPASFAVGAYSVDLTGLTAGTLYYINAYASNSIGTGYGTVSTFTTVGVTTTAASAIGPFTASSGGNITSDGGNAVTAYGVCYGTSANPDISGDHTTDGAGTGIFTSSLSLPTPSTLYHIRAYATNSQGTFYGSDLTFTTTCDPGSITGTTPTSRCGTGTVSLLATASAGATMNWYAAATGGSSLGTGSPFITPSISGTTDFFVSSTQGTTNANIGAVNTGISASLSSQTSTTSGINFDVYASSVTISSVDIYPTVTIGTSFTFTVKQGATTIATYTGTTTVSGTTSAPLVQTVPVNFVIPAGTGYQITAPTNPGLIRNNGGSAFPYTISDVISLTSSTVSGYYYTFYNWSVVVPCESARTSVTATVTPSPALTLSADQTVCNNAIAAISVTSALADYDTYVWTPITGLFTDADATIAYTTGTSATTVYVKTTTAGALVYTCSSHNSTPCDNVATSTVTVREAINLAIVASANPICLGATATLTGVVNYVPGTPTYTAPPAVTNPTTDEDLGNVTFGTLNNTTAVNDLTGTLGTATGTAGSYSDFTSFTPASFNAGSAYPFSLTSITAGSSNYNNGFAVYIDYNRNGVFTDAGEAAFISPALVSGPHIETGSITIPVTAAAGNTRMRVICKETSLITSPTGSVSYGEFEEYTINIVTGVGYTFAWSTGSSLSAIDVTPLATTAYTVTVTDPNFCTKSTSINIEVASEVTLVTAPVASAVCAGQTATFNVVASGAGLAYQWKKDGTDISVIDNPSAGTNTLSLPAITDADAANYSVHISSGCGSPITTTPVALTVKPLPSASASSDSPVCDGSALHLNGVTLTGTTFSWTGPGGFVSSDQNPTISPVTLASAGTYTFTASFSGCSSTPATTNVVVNPLPSAVTVTPSAPTILPGDIQPLTASGGLITSTLLTEDFNGSSLPGWTAVNNSTGGTDPTAAAWMLYISGGTIVSNDNTNFIASNSDAQGEFGITATELITPTINSTGYTSLSLSFYHYYAYYYDEAIVDVSTDGGATWITPALMTYTSTQGAGTSWAHAVLDLSAYVNQANLKVRFSYNSEWGYYWCIDNVTITGSQSAPYTWTPIADLYTDATATTPYVLNTEIPTVYAKPGATVTYTATATSLARCASTADVTVTVTALATVTTDAVTLITTTGGTSGGNVTSDGGAAVTAKGVCWSTSPNPTLGVDNFTTDGTGTGTFVSTITGLTAGTLYYVRAYATNSVGTAYGAVDVEFTTVAATKTLEVSVFLESLYDAGTGLMRMAQDVGGPKFDDGISDQVTVELHDATTPYAVAYTYSDINMYSTGTVTINTIPGNITGSYYIVIKNRNSIETWSAAPVDFSVASPINYNFTTAASQAYGDNMKLMGTVYTIWGGDATQDGIVDGSDMSAIFNASTALLTGYVPEDVNGDGIVDGSDMSLIYNNSTSVIQVQKP